MRIDSMSTNAETKRPIAAYAGVISRSGDGELKPSRGSAMGNKLDDMLRKTGKKRPATSSRGLSSSLVSPSSGQVGSPASAAAHRPSSRRVAGVEASVQSFVHPPQIRVTRKMMEAGRVVLEGY